MQNLHSLYQHSRALPDTDTMPVFFFGHGSPMNAIEENEFTQTWMSMVT